MKKVCFTAKTSDGEKTFKFGVFNTKKWLKKLMSQLMNLIINFYSI